MPDIVMCNSNYLAYIDRAIFYTAWAQHYAKQKKETPLVERNVKYAIACVARARVLLGGS
jgi:hypothetical protein